jgi:hypothetical protein
VQKIYFLAMQVKLVVKKVFFYKLTVFLSGLNYFMIGLFCFLYS